jgi:transposase
MAYREVTVVEVREVLRQWSSGAAKKLISRRLGVAPKTVRRYVALGEAAGVRAGDPTSLTEERLSTVMRALTSLAGRPHGESWTQCEQERGFIEQQLAAGVRLTKVRKLLRRRNVEVPYATLHRFAVEMLGFGRTRATIPVAEGEPGNELQVDTAWLPHVVVDERGRRRRLRVWIFTPSLSRYRFVYPCLEETTASAIEACEAAWSFYGGVFRVLIPDNTKTIVAGADALHPRITEGFLEYAQSRGFVIDPTRVRRPTDKARVERSVQCVRDDCFGGEHVTSVEHARQIARHWCADDYGMHRHSRTLRKPREHFESDERSALLPAPTERYDVPHWCDPKVARDHFAQVQRALYSLPTKYIGKTLRARADWSTVRFYDGGVLIKTHPRKPAGGRSTDASDFPADAGATARRDLGWIQRRAAELGPHVGELAKILLDDPLPWTRVRRVYALMGLAKKHGAARVDEACAIALELSMHDVRRLERMLLLGVTRPEPAAAPKQLPLPRYLRPSNDWALPRHDHTRKGGPT